MPNCPQHANTKEGADNAKQCLCACSLLFCSMKIELRGGKQKTHDSPSSLKWNQFLRGRLLHRVKTLLVPVFGFAAETLKRPQNGRATSTDRGGRDSWERTIHLDGRPVDRYTIGSGRLPRPHRLLKGAKGGSSPLAEEAVGKNPRRRLFLFLGLHPAPAPLPAFAISPFFCPRPLKRSTLVFSTSKPGPALLRSLVFVCAACVRLAARAVRITCCLVLLLHESTKIIF